MVSWSLLWLYAISTVILLFTITGPSSARVVCKRQNCEWKPWKRWTHCNAECGEKGMQVRLRNLKHGAVCGGLKCEGNAIEIRPCKRQCSKLKTPEEAKKLETREIKENQQDGSGEFFGSGDTLGSGENFGSGDTHGSGGFHGSGEIPSTQPPKITQKTTFTRRTSTETTTRKPPKTPPPITVPSTAPVQPSTTTVRPIKVPPKSTCHMSLAANGDTVIDLGYMFWRRDVYCKIYEDVDLDTDHYKVSAELYFDGGRTLGGVLGLMYNVLDSNNFDFVLFRTSAYGWCYEYGYYTEGLRKVHDNWHGDCNHGAPFNEAWFKVSVHVTDNEGHITLDGYPVVSVTPHYRATSQGGIIAAKGYRTFARYKNYQIENEIVPSNSQHFTLYGCLAGSRDTYLAADPDTRGTYCRVVVSEIEDSSWVVSVNFFNEMIWQGISPARTGVMYQFIDPENYNLVTFKFVEDLVCARGIQVQKNDIHKISSEECIDNAPPGDTWFTVEVKVGANNYVTTYLDKQRILGFQNVKQSAAVKMKAGVAIANGHIGILRFKDFRVEPTLDVIQDELPIDGLFKV